MKSYFVRLPGSKRFSHSKSLAFALGLLAATPFESTRASSTEESHTANGTVAPAKPTPTQNTPATVTDAETNAKPTADLEENPKDYFNQNYLFADWGGGRTWLADKGITFNGSMTADLLANVSGGEHREFVPASSLGLEAIFNLDKLVGIPGAEFDVSMIWRTGENLSGKAIGNLLTVAQLYGGQNLRLYNLFWKQSFLNDDLIFKIGRLGAFDDFLASPMHWNYINNGFDGNPKGIFYDVPGFGNSVYPTSSWGFFTKYQSPERDWYLQAGLYGLSSQNGVNSVSGTNFTFNFDQGPALLVQGGYLLNMKPDLDGLAGKYSMGVFYNSTRFTNYNGGSDNQSNEGVYWMLQQMVYRNPGEKNRKRQPGAFGYDNQAGITLWASIVYAPDTSINPYPVNANLGAVYQGVIPCRDQDFLAFGWALLQSGGDYSNYLSNNGQYRQSSESVLELNYRCNLTRFFYIQPGLQWVLNAGATNTIPDALVVGAQVGVTF